LCGAGEVGVFDFGEVESLWVGGCLLVGGFFFFDDFVEVGEGDFVLSDFEESADHDAYQPSEEAVGGDFEAEAVGLGVVVELGVVDGAAGVVVFVGGFAEGTEVFVLGVEVGGSLHGFDVEGA